MSTDLPEEYAGEWRRPFSHPDTNVLIHPSAATDRRAEGTAIAAPGGWYNAGDYNKYIVNSGAAFPFGNFQNKR
ncbi:MAG: glycoside hydrolase family 9 protein [Phaeodactylibacter sp.]|nr:glycoside hydrolase family 9 protein [Phaeodactylibacter sp.]